jgi:hypothetical protein
LRRHQVMLDGHGGNAERTQACRANRLPRPVLPGTGLYGELTAMEQCEEFLTKLRRCPAGPR